ncbi:MAG TPA: hypothetical protein VKB37_11155 [Jatrophihabitantaceae bacterium]|nr:hypothetical protein [Jatrophihabitantaceae bacterium]
MVMTRIRRWAAFVSITFAAAMLVPAATATAATPDKGAVEVFPYQGSADCSPYGFTFDNNVKGQESFWVQTFFDTHGNPVKQVTHDSFSETDTNSVSGKTLRLSGKRVETLDFVLNTRTDVGIDFIMIDPGTGAVILDVGRVVFDAPFHVSFEAGPHPVLHGDIDQLACTALAAA